MTQLCSFQLTKTEVGGTNIARSKDVALLALFRFEVTLTPSQVLVSLHLFKLCDAWDVCSYIACGLSRDKVGRASSLKEKVGDLVWSNDRSVFG